jgi:hypothetical protein
MWKWGVFSVPSLALSELWGRQFLLSSSTPCPHPTQHDLIPSALSLSPPCLPSNIYPSKGCFLDELLLFLMVFYVTLNFYPELVPVANTLCVFLDALWGHFWQGHSKKFTYPLNLCPRACFLGFKNYKPVILVTWEEGIKRILVWDQPRQKVCKITSQPKAGHGLGASHSSYTRTPK